MDELKLNEMESLSYDAEYLWPAEDDVATSDEALLKLALRTYPKMNVIGVFELDPNFLCSKLHLTEEAFKTAFEALEKTKTVFKYDHETNEILIRDYFVATHKSVNKATRDEIMEELANVQSEEIIACFYKNVRDTGKDMRGKDALEKSMKKLVKANALN